MKQPPKPPSGQPPSGQPASGQPGEPQAGASSAPQAAAGTEDALPGWGRDSVRWLQGSLILLAVALGIAGLVGIFGGGGSHRRSADPQGDGPAPRPATGTGQSMPDLRLPTLNGGTGPSLASCSTPKCLTVYIAPWCGYCRAGTPLLLQLRTHLQGRAEMRFIVGMDAAEGVRRYAADFGGDTMLDPEGSFRVSGVPQFLVSDQTGAILNRVPGMPQTDNPADLADFLGIP